MIPLRGRAAVSSWEQPVTDAWRIATPGEPVHRGLAVRITDSPAVAGAGLYLSDGPDVVGPGPTIHLPASLTHIEANDVVIVSDDGHRVMVAWKNAARHNSLLLTERCDNYCIMCSQPPKERDDSYLYGRAKRIISALPSDARSIGFTGGEPTIDGTAFLDLIQHCASQAPHLAVHVLSNGRKFADREFTRAYADIPSQDLMVGIPLYSGEPVLHDFVVQAPGAFNETVKGILNLAAHGARIEIRVVVQRHTVPALGEIATFIARNLPFVDQVAIMGLEMTGLAKANAAIVWADPSDYRSELRDAYECLDRAGIFTRIYNHQLCVIDKQLWPAAVQSISDWKNDYPSVCDPCTVRDRCAGVFTTSGARLSSHLQPILAT
jgi:His-Xaa-Ser system radical SAM maturase HxsC